nr:4-hydroxy-tetrahydrodipicolinate reductase [Bacteroidota bacterium]
MKIALLGYGKMGRTIHKVAGDKGHEVVAIIDNENDWLEKTDELCQADVAIEFSLPDAAPQNIARCFDVNLPVACGTTGWETHVEYLKQRCQKENQSIITASNFSMGVNIFYRINTLLASLMNNMTQYNCRIDETHHRQKLDSPSGTAKTLAGQIIKGLDRKKRWVNQSSSNPDDLQILSKRLDEVPGTHAVTYHSDIDEIEIRHTAKGREGFATGAVKAAEWIIDRKGWFTIDDMLFQEKS